jgi:tripartite-type tricarboxylate transporter receptor subunit TctC
LNAEVVQILHSPDIKAIFIKEGAESVGNKPEEFAAILKSESAKWTKLVQASGMKAD